jgi:hypothetical protein
MKILRLDTYIYPLLGEYDCVIVPGFGGFVANRVGASINSDNHQMSPPKREVSFNRNLLRNDGLLVDAIADKQDVRFEQASEQVKARVVVLNRDLLEGKQLSFDKIGVVEMDTNGTVLFSPDKSSLFHNESFGFVPFHSPPIQRKKQIEKIEKSIVVPIEKATQKVAEAGTAKVRKLPSKKVWTAVAATVLLAMISWGAINLNLGQLSENMEYSFINPFSAIDAEKTYLPRPAMEAYVEEKEASKDEVEEWLSSIPKEKPVVAVVKKKAKVNKRFHIIGGCFEFEKNANKLLRRLKRKGFDAELVGQNNRGLHRVSFGGFASRRTAVAELNKIKSKHMKSAWLFVKR